MSIAICACHGVIAQYQKEGAFDVDSYVEMLRSIRDNAKDNKTIYLFSDQAAYHKEKQTVLPEMDKLNIKFVFNT